MKHNLEKRYREEFFFHLLWHIFTEHIINPSIAKLMHNTFIYHSMICYSIGVNIFLILGTRMSCPLHGTSCKSKIVEVQLSEPIRRPLYSYMNMVIIHVQWLWSPSVHLLYGSGLPLPIHGSVKYDERIWQRPNTFYRNISVDRARGLRASPSPYIPWRPYQQVCFGRMYEAMPYSIFIFPSTF